MLARPAHRRVLRGGRPVPAQHVASRRVRRRRGAPGRDARSGATSGQHRAVAHRSRGAAPTARCSSGPPTGAPIPLDLDVTRVRGTKNPDVTAIVALAPDLVVANQEENRPVDLDALRAAGVPVYVTDIRTLDDASHGAFSALGTHARRLRDSSGPAWLDDARAGVGRRRRARSAPAGRRADLATAVDGRRPRHVHRRSAGPARRRQRVVRRSRALSALRPGGAARRTISSSSPTSLTTSPPRTAPNPSPARSRCWSAADC